jgi:hypothetical protein
VPRWAQALHYLARAREYKLDDVERYQLMQVVHGYTGRCNEAAGSGCAPNTERILSWCRKTATSASNAVRIVR